MKTHVPDYSYRIALQKRVGILPLPLSFFRFQDAKISLYQAEGR